MYFVLNFSAQNGFDHVCVNLTDLDNLLLLASNILDCLVQDVSLFLFVDGTLIDENKYWKNSIVGLNYLSVNSVRKKNFWFILILRDIVNRYVCKNPYN